MEAAYQELSQKVAPVGMGKFDQVFSYKDVSQSQGYVLWGTSINILFKSDVPIAQTLNMGGRPLFQYFISP